MNGFSGFFQKIMDNGSIGFYIHTSIKRLPGRIGSQWFSSELEGYWMLVGHNGLMDSSCDDDNNIKTHSSYL